MCFDYDVFPEFLRQANRVFRKEISGPSKLICCECHVPILPNQEYEYSVGKWDGDVLQFCTCLNCVWLRQRIIEHEMKDGCPPSQVQPAFGELWEALDDGYAKAIGLISIPVNGEGNNE